MEEFPEILQFVCDYLNKEDIDYVIVGGVAVMYHGVPRTTIDIDFILQIDDEAITAFVDFLNSKGFVASADDLRIALSENSHSTTFFRNSLLRLDIQGVNSSFDKMTLERAVSVDLFNKRLNSLDFSVNKFSKFLTESLVSKSHSILFAIIYRAISVSSMILLYLANRFRIISFFQTIIESGLRNLKTILVFALFCLNYG